ncbi:MAG TPA: ferritin-like domain-containing protein [Actinomycetota bacterium]|nr:ferritin-like domain-containing protein [Actinomycetota bacterium]
MTNEEMIKLLNGDIQHEIRAALTYLQQHATAPGLRGQTLRDILAPEIPGELQHAILLADKVVSLGGTPDLSVGQIEKHTTVREMIQYDLELEQEAIKNYTTRAQQAEELGDLGLKVHLENLAAEEADHRDMLARLMRDIEEL